MLTAKLLQSIVAKSLDEKLLNETLDCVEPNELCEAFTNEVWLVLVSTIDGGEVEKKVASMQLLYQVLTRLTSKL